MATAARVRRDHGTGMVVVVVRWCAATVFFVTFDPEAVLAGVGSCGYRDGEPTVGVASGAERGRRGHADGGSRWRLLWQGHRMVGCRACGSVTLSGYGCAGHGGGGVTTVPVAQPAAQPGGHSTHGPVRLSRPTSVCRQREPC